jgi:hypothetical protein
VLAISLAWLSIDMTATTAVWRLLLPFTGIGVGMAFIGSPLAATATRNLPPELAGAGSGVFTAARQVGSVLGSASMAAVMDWLLSRQLPPTFTHVTPGVGGEGGEVAPLPEFRGSFDAAMSQAMLLPAFVALFGVVAAVFLVRFQRPQKTAPSPTALSGCSPESLDPIT